MINATDFCERCGRHPIECGHDEADYRMDYDPDAATGCADDQAFATVPVDVLRRIADA